MPGRIARSSNTSARGSRSSLRAALGDEVDGAARALELLQLPRQHAAALVRQDDFREVRLEANCCSVLRRRRSAAPRGPPAGGGRPVLASGPARLRCGARRGRRGGGRARRGLRWGRREELLRDQRPSQEDQDGQREGGDETFFHGRPIGSGARRARGGRGGGNGIESAGAPRVAAQQAARRERASLERAVDARPPRRRTPSTSDGNGRPAAGAGTRSACTRERHRRATAASVMRRAFARSSRRREREVGLEAIVGLLACAHLHVDDDDRPATPPRLGSLRKISRTTRLIRLRATACPNFFVAVIPKRDCRRRARRPEEDEDRSRCTRCPRS